VIIPNLMAGVWSAMLGTGYPSRFGRYRKVRMNRYYALPVNPIQFSLYFTPSSQFADPFRHHVADFCGQDGRLS
jgi:hypothetical protein